MYGFTNSVVYFSAMNYQTMKRETNSFQISQVTLKKCLL